ncbi:MAG: glutamine-hydrolyzing GMP synthase [Nitrososphaerota archaeon]|nr:glutamine-hydrolyzing GMP synthase [Nitrososphaerota archaeon]MDG6923034.1 glutamine-hydrolyzing GMP synthase [Nitrososphaerota archaeon]
MRDTGSLEKIIVLDFGAQYAHLICRRIRELGVYAELVPFDISPDEVIKRNTMGIILSGGPKSVYVRGSPLPNKKLYAIGLPVLGICYGLQAVVHQNGGRVSQSSKREFGKAILKINSNIALFKGLGTQTVCWMSHGDAAESLPLGFASIASTSNSQYAAISSGNIFAVQFHPEVTHTEHGMQILSNFVFEICKMKRNWTTEIMIEDAISELEETIGKDDRVICALSGGIDSATTAELLQRAIGKRLYCVFVDHGLLRKGEKEKIESAFRGKLGKNLIVLDDSRIFLKRLEGVRDPEKKRVIVGREFIKSFTRVSKRLGNIKWLAQGTLYTDIIESAAGSSKHESKIKSHHNVAGLPKRLGFKLVEPLKDFYKDEVRNVAAALGLSGELINTHPFPGPGLSVRIIGAVTKKKLDICRDASSIVEEELARAGLYNSVWQAYGAVGDDLATGVLGDERRMGHIVIVRVVESREAMTADWSRLHYDILEKISNRITNEVQGVTWVAYAISSKPPSTIEPQ